MEGEYCAIASFTEQCPALITDLFGGCDPAGGLEIKFTEALKPPVEFFRHQRNARFLCSPNRASLRRVFRAFPKRFFIVAQASSAYRRFFCAIAENEPAVFVKADGVRLSAAFLLRNRRK